MSQPEKSIIKKYREFYNFHGVYDVSMAVPWEDWEGVTPMHLKFFESIASGIESLGKRVFLPQRDYGEHILDEQEGKRRTHVLGRIIAPTSDLILDYMTMGSMLSSNIMTTFAHLQRPPVPVIHFIEKENLDEVHEPWDLELIVFDNQEDCVSKLKEAVRSFYEKRK